MTAVSVKWARLSGAVIAEFIVRKTRFSWRFFHKTHEFVDANGVALEPDLSVNLDFTLLTAI